MTDYQTINVITLERLNNAEYLSFMHNVLALCTMSSHCFLSLLEKRKSVRESCSFIGLIFICSRMSVKWLLGCFYKI